MHVTLKYVEVTDFKSFKGKHIIGPFKALTGIIGLSGSGKSNLIDAINFVLGVSARKLRVTSQRDLLYGSIYGNTEVKKALVTAIFQLDDGSEILFTREIRLRSSYYINGVIVPRYNYTEELKKIGLNMQTNTLLVHQGKIENISLMNPKELTSYLENISGSCSLIPEYMRLEALVKKTQDNILGKQITIKLKNSILSTAKKEMAELEKFQEMEDMLDEQKLELQLIILYKHKMQIEELEDQLQEIHVTLTIYMEKKNGVEENLEQSKGDREILGHDLSSAHDRLNDQTMKVYNLIPLWIKYNGKVDYLQKKLENARKSVLDASKADTEWKQKMRKLETSLQEVQHQMLGPEITHFGTGIELDDSQVTEYYQLKQSTSKEDFQLQEFLSLMEGRHKGNQDQLDSENRKRTELEDLIVIKRHAVADLEQRLEKIKETHMDTITALKQKQEELASMEKIQEEAQSQFNEITKELDYIVERLADAEIFQHNMKLKNTVDQLKVLNSGVYGRIADLCQPVHLQFKIAITKALQNDMETIVVDSTITALDCLLYLKDKCIGYEKFVALDTIEATPIRDVLGNIKEPSNVCLLFDLLKFEPPEIKPAVMSICNNIVVCDKPEVASQVAFHPNFKTTAVTLDGLLYSPQGLISGGTVTIENKVKRWNDKYIFVLLSNQAKLREELSALTKKTNARSLSAIHSLKSDISVMECRCKYTQNMKKQTLKWIQAVNMEVDEVQAQLSTTLMDIDEIINDMKPREEDIQSIKERLIVKEDKLFAKFCQKIGADNIREYEERRLSVIKEKVQKLQDLKKLQDCIQQQLSMEDKQITICNLKHWEHRVEEYDQELKNTKLEENEMIEHVNNDIDELKCLKKECSIKTNMLDDLDEEIEQVQCEEKIIAREIYDAESLLLAIEGKIMNVRAQRHSVIKYCKVSNIKIPFENNLVEDETSESSSLISSADKSGTSLEELYMMESQLIVDYSSLPLYLTTVSITELEKELSKRTLQMTYVEQQLQARKLNFKAFEKYHKVYEDLHVDQRELIELKKIHKDTNQQFKGIISQREILFKDCVNHITNHIDTIYKALNKSQEASASLSNSSDEPYKYGTMYFCTVPGKMMHPLSDMSGSERVIASLALIYAIQSFRSLSIMIFDEIDACLDKTNLINFIDFIKGQASFIQTILISLNKKMYSQSKVIIGVSCDDWAANDGKRSSEVFPVDLDAYQE